MCSMGVGPKNQKPSNCDLFLCKRNTHLHLTIALRSVRRSETSIRRKIEQRMAVLSAVFIRDADLHLELYQLCSNGRVLIENNNFDF